MMKKKYAVADVAGPWIVDCWTAGLLDWTGLDLDTEVIIYGDSCSLKE